VIVEGAVGHPAALSDIRQTCFAQSDVSTLLSISTVPPHGQPRASFTKEAFDGAAEL
jgi:hypothetical protein